MTESEYVVIRIRQETRDRLLEVGKKKETYDDVIKRLNKKVESIEEIRKHIGELLIYMDDERKDYEAMLKNGKNAKNHVWIDIKEIGKWVGMTQDDAWKLYGPVFDKDGHVIGLTDEINVKERMKKSN